MTGVLMATIPKKLTLELNIPDEVLIDTPCGLFIRKDSHTDYDFVTLGAKVTSFPLRATFAKARCISFDILQSCNGLLLCTRKSHEYWYVYNPFTKKIKNIPFARKLPLTNEMLAFDPTKSPYYKAMITVKTWNHQRYREEDSMDDDSYAEQIQIYSSETGKLRICDPPFPQDTFLGLRNGVYWNNAIHWIHYNTNRHCKLDIVDHPVVTEIKTPTLDNDVNDLQTKLFQSRGSLLLLMADYDYRYHVFEMREESSEWLVKYIIDDLIIIVPERPIHRDINSCFLSIVLGEREDDSFMVIESHDKIVRYNFVSKTVSILCNFISETYDCFGRAPFIASLAGV